MSLDFQLTDSSWEAAKTTKDWLKERRLSRERKPRAKPFGAASETLDGGLRRIDGGKHSAIGEEEEARVSLFNGSEAQLGLGLLIDNIFTDC